MCAALTLVEVNPEELLLRNQDLAKILRLIGRYYTDARDTHRSNTFTNAGNMVAQSKIIIMNGAQAKTLFGKGIGPGTMEVINEFVATYDKNTRKAVVSRLEGLKRIYGDKEEIIRFETVSRQDVIDLFESIYKIGPAIANKFYDKGYRTLEDLWNSGELTHEQQVGIMWREHIALPIAREEMDLINQKIGSILNPYGIKWIMAGSYLREAPSSGDIDIVIVSRPDFNMEGIIYLLKDYLPATLSLGELIYRGMFRLDEKHNGHRIDIVITPDNQYIAALMHAIGSGLFNTKMSERAREFGYKLSKEGLFDQFGQPFNLQSEQDIFNILRVKYIPPSERTKTINDLEFI